MAFKDKIINWIQPVVKKVGLFNGGEAVNSSLPYHDNWFFTAELGVPRKLNVYELRQFAKSCWVVMIKNAIKKQVMNADWDIVPVDNEDETNYSSDIEKITRLLKHPNRNGDTFWYLWGIFLNDVLDMDGGSIFKARNYKGDLVELFAYDGARFLKKVDEKGILDGYYQYSFRNSSAKPIFFDKDEIVYGCMFPNSESYPYGFSPLQSIQQEVELMIQSTRYNKDFFQNNAIPDGIIEVDMPKLELDRFRDYWKKEIQNKPHKLAIHNAKTNFTNLRISNQDMQWLDGQKWYFHLVFAVYGLSPQEVGFYENSNRSTGDSQERVSVKNAVKPYLKLIEDKINNEIIPELIDHDKIKFKFIMKDDVAEKIEHEQSMAKVKLKIYTINEVRRKEGLKPVAWGDAPVQESSNNEVEEKEDNPKKNDKSFINKDKNTDEAIEETNADDYADFLYKHFRSWEKEVLNALDKELKEDLSKSVSKNFAGFMSRLFNIINTSAFYGSLLAIVKADFKKGVEEAENELNIDIGFSLDIDKEVKVEADKQLEGFTIEDKRWVGIKGVSQELQDKVRDIVIVNRTDKTKGLQETKEDIKSLFNQYVGGNEIDGEITEGRVMTIARTESNRMTNKSKLDSYKRSKVVEFKVWDAFLDNRTSPICSRLDGQKVRLDEEFVDPKTGKRFMHPPSHINCRSSFRR